MKQSLIWIPEAIDNGATVKSIPPIPYDGPTPVRLWTLFLETDKTSPPLLPFNPQHWHNAFLEDFVHDWNIRQDALRYYSRASNGGHWALLEFK